MTDQEVMIVLWLILLVMGFIFRKPPIAAIGSVFGFYLGFELSSISHFITLALFSTNLYTIYVAFDNWDQA